MVLHFSNIGRVWVTSIKGETTVVVMMQLQKLNLPALQRNYSFVFGFLASVSYQFDNWDILALSSSGEFDN